LGWTDVSVVVPVGALSFLFTAFLAQHALGEHVTPQRWAGTILIVLGISLVARTQSPRVDSRPGRTTNTSATDRAVGPIPDR
jgi:drug/metabolite transporter (DMT)-like permease